MNLAELKVFLAVYECGGVTQAAEKLHCVQSNVTARLKQLESRLGVTLFVRKSRRMEITPRGRVLLDYAERLLGLADEAEMALRGEGGHAGLLRLGSMETTAAVRLPGVLSRFHQQHPQIRMQLVTGPTRDTIARVRDHDLDIGFVAGPVGALDLSEQWLWQEHLVLMTERHHPPVRRASQLANRTILVFRHGCAYRQRVEHWLAAENVAPDAVLEFGSFQAIVGAVHAGMGVAILPKSVLDVVPAHWNITTHALPAWCDSAVTSMIWRPGSLALQPVRLLIEHLSAAVHHEQNQPAALSTLRRPA